MDRVVSFMCHGVLYDDVMMLIYEDVKTVVALACKVLQDAAGTTSPPPQKMNSAPLFETMGFRNSGYNFVGVKIFRTCGKKVQGYFSVNHIQ